MAHRRYRRPRPDSAFNPYWSPRQADRHVQHDRLWYCSVSLELHEYLRELGAHAAELRHRTTLPLRCFIELLEAPLLRPLPSTSAAHAGAAAPGYPRWEQTLHALSEDFEAMARSGVLEQDPLMLFMAGAHAPSGMHWYNFNVDGFLSAGAAAMFYAGRVQGSTITWEKCADFLYMGAHYE